MSEEQPIPNESSGVEEKKIQAQAEQSTKEDTKAERYYQKAVPFYERKDYDEAITYIRSALSLDPTNPKYHYNIAYIYSLKELPEVAINHYKLYLKYAPNEPDAPYVESRIQLLQAEVMKKIKR